MKLLTEDEVIEAAKVCKTKTDAAKILGVSFVTLHRMVKSSPNLQGLFPTRKEWNKMRTPGCLTGVTKEAVKMCAKNGMTRKDTALALGVSYGIIYKVSKHYKIKFNRR